MNRNVRRFGVFVSSILICFSMRCLSAEQPTVLVVAQDGSQLFYHENGQPIDSEEIPKGTELKIESTSGERCFVTYKGKQAYIRRQFLLTRQEFLDAQQKATQEQVVLSAANRATQEQVRVTLPASTTNAVTNNGARAAAIHSVIQNLKARADAAIESGHYHYIGAMFISYDGDYAEETAAERKQLAAEYDEKARMAEEAKLAETKRFEAEQTAKGLVDFHGEWITPTEKDVRVAKKAEEARQQAEHDKWVDDHKSEIIQENIDANFKANSLADAAYPDPSDFEKHDAYWERIRRGYDADICKKYGMSQTKFDAILTEWGLENKRANDEKWQEFQNQKSNTQ